MLIKALFKSNKRRLVVRYKFICISEECTSPFFRVPEASC
jgi:hypothetical protein